MVSDNLILRTEIPLTAKLASVLSALSLNSYEAFELLEDSIKNATWFSNSASIFFPLDELALSDIIARVCMPIYEIGALEERARETREGTSICFFPCESIF
jgi:hypothetical protein